MMKRDVVVCSQLVKIGVIRYDRRNFYRQQTALVSEQQIVQAVADFRHHQHHAGLLACIVQLPVHLHAHAQCGKIGAQLGIGNQCIFGRKMNAHEKQLRLCIAKLGRINNVAAVFSQETRHAMHDAALVQA